MSKFPAQTLFGAILALTALTSEAGEIIDYPQCPKLPDECLEEAIFKLQAQIETQAQAQQEIIAQLASQQKALNEQIVALKKMIEAQQEALKKAVANLQQKMSALETTNQAQDEKLRKTIQSLRDEVASLNTIRYIDNGDGTVTDNRTGLLWLKNANCFGRQNWKTAMLRAAKLAHGQCGLNDSSKAGDWRLPTEDEWEVMVDGRYEDPALSNATGTGQWKEGNAFTGVLSRYWSSTDIDTSRAWAWVVDLDGGSVGTIPKTATGNVWAVRGGH